MSLRFIIFGAVLTAALPVQSQFLSSAISYQGELRVSNAPANGSFDFQFELYDDPTAGSQVASPVLIEDLVISNGIFSVDLDFGFLPFDGSALWIEIGVRDGSSSGGYQGLAPRQRVAAAPYSLHAVKAEMVDTVPAHDHIGEVWRDSVEGFMLELRNTIDPDTTSAFTGAMRLSSNSDDQTLYAINNPSDGTGDGVYGVTNGTGPGVRARSRLGPGLIAQSFASTNVIEAYDEAPTGPDDLVFRVTSGGNVRADGTFTGGGADVAEFIDTNEPLERGDVVGIAEDGTFARVRRAGSTTVAGVVTTHPGLLMNATEERETLDDGPAMALAGRVPVKVTSQGGAIRPGDLLIASDVPGHAMRAPEDPRPGTVIGKALEAMGGEHGMVDMLVMLR